MFRQKDYESEGYEGCRPRYWRHFRGGRHGFFGDMGEVWGRQGHRFGGDFGGRLFDNGELRFVILQLIAEEHTSSEIATMLFISEKTVEKHRASLMEKLNVRNLAGLVRLAVKYHLVD